MKENELVSIEIDLEKLKGKNLNEGALVAFGSWMKDILNMMFGAAPTSNIRIRGRSTDLDALAQVLGREKRYMESYLKHGLNDDRVLGSRFELEKAVYNFERETGIKWPLK